MRRLRFWDIKLWRAAEPTPSISRHHRAMPFRGHCPGRVTFLSFRARFNLATAAFLYLAVIVILSLQGSFVSSAIVSLLGVMGLAYFFAPPIFSLRMDDPFNLVAIIAFLIVSAVITRLVSKLRSARRSWRPKSSSGSEPRKRCSVPERSWSASPA